MKKTAIILAIVVLLAGAYFGWGFLKERGGEGQRLDMVSLSIAQYSDREITPNAIIKDQRFEHIAFAEPEKKDKKLFENQLASVGRIFKAFLFLKSKKINQNEYGVWVWTPTLQMTGEYIESILTDIKKEGVNVVYLSIDSYLDVYALPEGREREEKEEQFAMILEQFIIAAKNKGMAVDAEAGWRNWAEEGHTYKPFVILNFVKNFNANHELKFRGFQYDIEPYLLDSYMASEEGKKIVLGNLMKLVDQTTDHLKSSDLKFSVVIPDFYDKKSKITPKFSYNNRKDYAFGHLLNILENKPESSIIVMSYRNFAEGEDGSIDVSKNELKIAKLGRFNTNIIIAQETGDVPPPYITFHNTSKTYFKEEVNKLYATFNSNPNFAGIAVHYANAFMALK